MGVESNWYVYIYPLCVNINVCNLDYGLATLRRNRGASEDPVKFARQEACKVYLAPEALSAINPSPTGPADVFSYAVILFEIATRIDPYSVCAVMCT